MELTDTTSNRESAPSGFVLPADVSEWVSAATLREWVLAEVATLNWEHPDLKEYLRTHPNFQPQGLLCLLTLAYATGTFESEEIVAQCYREPSLRALVSGCIPTAAEIGKFRKENRGLLKWTLAQVFKRATRARFSLGELVPAGIRQAIVNDASGRLDLSRHMDRATQGA